MSRNKKIAVAKQRLKGLQEKYGGPVSLALKYYTNELTPVERKRFIRALLILPIDSYVTF